MSVFNWINFVDKSKFAFSLDASRALSIAKLTNLLKISSFLRNVRVGECSTSKSSSFSSSSTSSSFSELTLKSSMYSPKIQKKSFNNSGQFSNTRTSIINSAITSITFGLIAGILVAKVLNSSPIKVEIELDILEETFEAADRLPRGNNVKLIMSFNTIIYHLKFGMLE